MIEFQPYEGLLSSWFCALPAAADDELRPRPSRSLRTSNRQMGHQTVPPTREIGAAGNRRCDQGRLGTGSGRSLPDGRWHGLLAMAQSEQPWTNLLTSLAILGHQKRSFSSEWVLLAPGWPVPREVWTE